MELKKEKPLNKKESLVEFKYLKDPHQRFLLGQAVENIVDSVASISEKKKSKRQNIVFLDKSARPLSTYFLNIWKKKFPDKISPNISFLNVGRELKSRDNEAPAIESQKIKDEIKRLKKEYSFLKKASKGDRVLIIDDIESSGFTKTTVLKILKKAFPDLNFQYKSLVVSRNNTNKKSLGLFDNKIERSPVYPRGGIKTYPSWSKLVLSSPDHKDIFSLSGVVDSKLSLTSKPFYTLEVFQPGSKERERISKLKKAPDRTDTFMEILYETQPDKNGSYGEVIDTLNNAVSLEECHKIIDALYDGRKEINKLRKEINLAANEYWENK